MILHAIPYIGAELPPDPMHAENGADKELMEELENIFKVKMIHGVTADAV